MAIAALAVTSPGEALRAEATTNGASTLAGMPPAPRTPAPSTQRMAALLEKIRRESDPAENPFRSEEQVPILQTREKETRDPAALLKVKAQLALQLLQIGECEQALAKYEEIERGAAEKRLPLDPNNLPQLWTDQAVCLLRLGEQENCCARHNADSCIFPIGGKGVHTRSRGSRGAIARFTELLNKHPNDLQARWLLNIAYSTLDEYPSGVPSDWLIAPELFASEYPLKRFPDVAAAVGIDIDALAGGIVLDDFDQDGLLDVMVSAWGLTDPLRCFRNQGDGTFVEHTEAAGLVGENGGLNLIQTDYNNDGWVDVLVLRGAWLMTEGHYPLSLLRNNGDFTFTDVTEEAGLLRFHPTQTAVWFDFDGDGWLDLFVGNESTEDDVKPCELFHNNGDGTFTERAEDCGLRVIGYVKGVISGDFNNDGRPDLFISRRDGPPTLIRNDGPGGGYTAPRLYWHFTDVTDEAGITDPNRSFPCWFWDYDNDGWTDIFVTGYAIRDAGDVAADVLGLPTSGEKARLYRNSGDGTFEDVTRKVGLNKILHAMGANYGDLDNDGWLDFYVGTGDPKFSTLLPNRMFRNAGGARFQDVTTSGGFGQLQKGHGIAFGDINNDGDQDIYSVVGGAVPADHFHHQIFANPGHRNRWLKLKLTGTSTNRAAIGARVKVVLDTPEGERVVHRTVSSGGSFGASPLRLEIGLGQAQAIRRVEVFWPVTRETQVFTGFELDRAYAIREGEDAIQPQSLRPFPWPVSGGGPDRNPERVTAGISQ